MLVEAGAAAEVPEDEDGADAVDATDFEAETAEVEDDASVFTVVFAIAVAAVVDGPDALVEFDGAREGAEDEDEEGSGAGSGAFTRAPTYRP